MCYDVNAGGYVHPVHCETEGFLVWKHGTVANYGAHIGTLIYTHTHTHTHTNTHIHTYRSDQDGAKGRRGRAKMLILNNES